jgi:hypothetical protein
MEVSHSSTSATIQLAFETFILFYVLLPVLSPKRWPRFFDGFHQVLVGLLDVLILALSLEIVHRAAEGMKL